MSIPGTQRSATQGGVGEAPELLPGPSEREVTTSFGHTGAGSQVDQSPVMRTPHGFPCEKFREAKEGRKPEAFDPHEIHTVLVSPGP